MNLQLALVIAARPADCTLRLLDAADELRAHYSPPIYRRITLCPRQLVAVDVGLVPPIVVWRWFRGVVVLRRDDHVVVDNHVYQPGLRVPISVVRLPEVLEDAVQLGDEVFYSLGAHGVVVDTVRGAVPAHPARLAADLFPALRDVYAELAEREGA